MGTFTLTAAALAGIELCGQVEVKTDGALAFRIRGANVVLSEPPAEIPLLGNVYTFECLIINGHHIYEGDITTDTIAEALDGKDTASCNFCYV